MTLRAKINPNMLPALARNNSSASSSSPSDADDVLFAPNRAIRTITLNRPAKLNSLNQSMVDKIIPRMVEWTKSDTAQSIILKGAGNKALCAGGDVAALANDIAQNGPEGSARSTVFFKDEYTLNHLIASYPKPYIAVMNGITMGGGVGLSVHAPFRIATEKTLFAMPETDIGFFPDVGGSFFLSRLDGQIGTYLALTSARLKGYDAVAAGIATHYIPESLLPDVESRLAEVFVDSVAPIDAHSLVNSVLLEFETAAPEGYVFSLSGKARESIDAAFSNKTVEDIVAALEADGSDIAKSALKAILSRSPTAVKVTLAALRRGETLGIKDALDAEYRLAENFMYGHEFVEGVSAKLISKPARTPEWKPATLQEVTPDIVNGYISNRPDSVVQDIEFIHPENNFTKYPHTFGLPSEQQIKDYVLGNDNPDREFKVSAQEVHEHFDNITRGKLGVHQKIDDIIVRMTKPDPTDVQLLDWIY